MNNAIDRPTDNPTASPAPAELVRGLYADLDAERITEALARIAPDAVLHVPGHHPAAGDFVGHDGLATFLLTSAGIAAVDEEVEDVLVGAHTVAALVRVRGTREDGRSLDNDTVHRFRIEDGLIHEVWFHNLDQHAVDAFWR